MPGVFAYLPYRYDINGVVYSGQDRRGMFITIPPFDYCWIYGSFTKDLILISYWVEDLMGAYRSLLVSLAELSQTTGIPSELWRYNNDPSIGKYPV